MSSPIERAIDDLSRSLERHFAALEPWLESDAGLWSRRPPDGGWCVAEVLEHVALANHFLLKLVDKLRARALRRSSEGVRPPSGAPDFAPLERLASRQFHWTHPEHMTPRGDADPRQLAQRLAAQRERCLAILRELPRGEGSLHTIRMSVVDARLDLYQYLRLIDLHLARHLRQLERLRSDAGRAPRGPDGAAPAPAGP